MGNELSALSCNTLCDYILYHGGGVLAGRVDKKIIGPAYDDASRIVSLVDVVCVLLLAGVS